MYSTKERSKIGVTTNIKDAWRSCGKETLLPHTVCHRERLSNLRSGLTRFFVAVVLRGSFAKSIAPIQHKGRSKIGVTTQLKKMLGAAVEKNFTTTQSVS